jgi:hypothetical protein
MMMTRWRRKRMRTCASFCFAPTTTKREC